MCVFVSLFSCGHEILIRRKYSWRVMRFTLATEVISLHCLINNLCTGFTVSWPFALIKHVWIKRDGWFLLTRFFMFAKPAHTNTHVLLRGVTGTHSAVVFVASPPPSCCCCCCWLCRAICFWEQNPWLTLRDTAASTYYPKPPSPTQQYSLTES